jgi:murein DD-endopeptidase MepM/ murein hydrolase activator NlpD
MRSSYYDLIDRETDDPAGAPPDPGADGDATDGGDAVSAAEPGDDAAAEPPPEGAIEPPLWRTADNHLLHLPPAVIERILARLLRRRTGMPVPGPRPPWRPSPRRRRRRAINTLGQLVQRATRVGTRRLRPGFAAPVFRSRVGGRSFRILARPRAGLRNEIMDVELESDLLSELEEDLTTTPKEPKSTGVPFAALPPAGSYWPVVTSHPQANVVSYRPTVGKTIGREGRVFKAGRTGVRNGVKTARNHCGIDLFARRNDPVIACENGTIVDFSFFYNAKSGQRTYKILVEHSGAVVNYGEVRPDSFARTGLKPGMTVKAGQVIGFVSDTDMLHFEMYTKGSKSAYRWWKGESAPPRLLDPTRYLLHLVVHGKRATGASVPPPPSKTATPSPSSTTSTVARPPTATSSEVADALRIAKREVPGMTGTTTEALIEQWRQRICPEVPRSILIAFIKYESGGKFTDATHGTKANGWTSPDFYELGIFQTPGGLHGRCTSGDWKSCEVGPPGREGKSPSPWVRLCAKIGADPKQWTNPVTQVRVGLLDLEDGATGLRKAFPELFPKPGSDWDIRMALLYRFSRGGGYARSFLRPFRSQLAAMPEAQRWGFLRDKSVQVTVTSKGKRRVITRTFKGENVEKKMALAAKLGYTPGAGGRP